MGVPNVEGGLKAQQTITVYKHARLLCSFSLQSGLKSVTALADILSCSNFFQWLITLFQKIVLPSLGCQQCLTNFSEYRRVPVSVYDSHVHDASAFELKKSHKRCERNRLQLVQSNNSSSCRSY